MVDSLGRYGEAGATRFSMAAPGRSLAQCVDKLATSGTLAAGCPESAVSTVGSEPERPSISSRMNGHSVLALGLTTALYQSGPVSGDVTIDDEGSH